MSEKPKTQKEKVDALWTVLLGVNGEDGFIKESRNNWKELLETVRSLSISFAQHLADPARAVERFMTKNDCAEIIAEREKTRIEKASLGESKKLTRTERIIMFCAAVGTFVSLGALVVAIVVAVAHK